MWETARLRVAIAENRTLVAGVAAANEDVLGDPVAKLRLKVIDALERGGTVQWCVRV
eukprot:COSAG02_NODE_158_length_32954_cov_16.416771_4_plen_57_part_00